MEKQHLAPVSTTELIVGRPNLSDIYLKLSESKFILVYKKGVTLNETSLEGSQFSKKVQEFWVEKKYLHQFTLRNINLTGNTLKNSKVDLKTKVVMLSRTVDSLLNELRHTGFNQHSFLRAKMVAELSIQLINNNYKLSELINSLNQLSNDSVRSALTTSCVSVMLAEQLGYQAEQSMSHIALGALLRDIGLTQMNPELSSKKFENMTLAERQQYLTHPERGVKLLTRVPYMANELLCIVHQHEELPDGSGFPNQIKKMTIHPMAEVVIVAGLFADLILQTRKNPKPITVREAATAINSLKQPFSLKLIRGLFKVISQP